MVTVILSLDGAASSVCCRDCAERSYSKPGTPQFYLMLTSSTSVKRNRSGISVKDDPSTRG